MAPVPSYYKGFPAYTPPPADEIRDDEEDRPRFELVKDKLGPFQVPPLIFGAATLSHHYNVEHYLQTDFPLRVVRLALRYGITAFDTSPYYGSSEAVLGQILTALEPEYPRSSYMLMTKCGRYGFNKSEFDYSPETIRISIHRSLDRLNTDYLDVVYLHDVDFVASPIYPEDRAGKPQDALQSAPDSWGLDQANREQVRGSGDQIILDALAELFKMKKEGKIKAVGITGYSLPVLLRLTTLAAKQPFLDSVDLVLTFCHLTLQNSSLKTFLPLFKEWGKVSQVVAASPLSMGLLTASPPLWHPAPKPLQQVSKEAAELCRSEGISLPAVALHYSLHTDQEAGEGTLPIVIGLSKPQEVHEVMEVYHNNKVAGGDKTEVLEEKVQGMYRDAGFENWAWASPPKDF